MQTDSIKDAQGFSSKTPITLSRGFSVETLIGITPSWKTKLNRSISTVEDRISGGLLYCHRRWACIIQKQYYHGDVISRWMGLHMTI